jgi:hypothetical protein
MPRTPAVYEAKARWQIKYEGISTKSEEWAPNYKTARERHNVLESKVMEDITSGKNDSDDVRRSQSKVW